VPEVEIWLYAWEADGRTRTGDPFITSVCRARDVGAVAGMEDTKYLLTLQLWGSGA
jgi:hypothetical protein